MVKFDVTNRLLRIAPHLGVALLIMLVNAGLITQTRKEELRREQTRRHLAGDTSTRVYEIAPDAPSRARQCLFYQTVSGFLGANDDTLEARTRFVELPPMNERFAAGGGRLRSRSPSRVAFAVLCVQVVSESLARRKRVASPFVASLAVATPHTHPLN